MGKLWDISQVLRPALPVWPGDSSFALEETWTIGPNCPVKVSKLSLSTHAGSHGDAPSHYHETGIDAASLELEIYIGPCVLLTASGTGPSVCLDDVDWQAVGDTKRVLIRTYDRFPANDWDDNFRTLDAAMIERLAAVGCGLVGVDSASIDPQTSKTMDAHNIVRKYDMRILEGLVFDGVPDGKYELIALPLKIAGADASPVRAVLRELE